MNNGLSANGVWLKAIDSPGKSTVSIVLHDKGKRSAGEQVSDRVNRGEEVLSLDLVFNGDAWWIRSPATPERETGPWAYVQMLHGTGDRALGLEVAQLLEIARWIQTRSSAKLRLEAWDAYQVVSLVPQQSAPAFSPKSSFAMEFAASPPQITRGVQAAPELSAWTCSGMTSIGGVGTPTNRGRRVPGILP
jgi:hypothetical protein